MRLTPILPPLQITAPSIEPVVVADAKAHLRVDVADDDILITGLIMAARQRAESYTQRSFISQQWRLYFDYNTQHGTTPMLHDRNPDHNVIRLPAPPIISLDAFEYLSAATTWTAVDPSLWHYDAGGMRIVQDDVLPEPYTYRSSFRATYTAGYGTTADKVPMAIQLAIKTLTLHFYENREAFTPNAMQGMPAAGESLLQPYKIMSY